MITVVLGGQYGDEGKGSVTSWLSSRFKFDMVMRFGGANAGHSCTKEGEVFDMQQLPCSWVNGNVNIYLPETALVDKEIFLKEVAQAREHGFKGKIWLSPRATLIDKEDKGWRETTKKIGTMGSGVAPTRAKRLLRMATKVYPDKDLLEFCEDDFTPHHILADRRKQILVEGSQGFGLSLNYGYYPYTTSTDLTLYNVLAECGVPYGVHEVKACLVIRTFPIRVPNPPDGTSGNMWNELTWEKVSEICGRDIKVQYDFRPPVYPEPIPKRIAEFDGELVKRAVWHIRPKVIFLTHMDWFFPQ